MRRIRRLLALCLAIAVIGLGCTGLAAAEPAPAGGRPPAPGLAMAGDAHPIGPGTTLSTFRQDGQGGPLRGEVIEADLTDPRLSVSLLTPPRVSQVRTVTELAAAGHAFAAVNGDLYDINNTGAPRGIEIADGTLLKGPLTEPVPWHQAVGIDSGRAGRIVEAYLEGTVVLASGGHRLDGLNQEQVPPDGGLDLFTPMWGSGSRAISGATRLHEVTVVGGVVVGHSATPGAGPIPTGGFVLVGTGADADLLAALPTGSPVSVTFGPRTEPEHTFTSLLGVRYVLVRNGEVPDGLDDRSLNPETALGFSRDGKRMWMVVIDGHSAVSRGVTVRGLATIMRRQGAYDAVVIDGGGSTEMVARDAGGARMTVRNVPSDGVEREVANGIGLVSAHGSGRLAGIRISNQDAVFTGLHRRLSAVGYDETYGPAALGAVRWSGADSEGLFTAGAPGDAPVTVTAGGVRGRAQLRVLPTLDRITVPQGVVDVVDGKAGTFGVTGYDATGASAPIDPVDVRLDYDHSLVSVRPGPDGTFSVQPRAGAGTTTVTVRVGDRVTSVGVAIGLVTEPVSGFETAADWRFTGQLSTGSLTTAPGIHGNAVRMAFDFTRSEMIRKGIVSPVTPPVLPGRVHRFTLSVDGDGKGEWLAVLVTDATGKSYSLYGDYVTWRGWRRTGFAVPGSVVYPITLTGVEAIETKRIDRYAGQLDFDDLAALASPEVAAAGPG
ncbi:MAG: phosphodiester glycosidase family protein [Kutzneria sp.]|nr:phosphodiester glycosidase family protein [Kutzneria sp.]